MGTGYREVCLCSHSFLHEKIPKHGSPYHQPTLALVGGEADERGYHPPCLRPVNGSHFQVLESLEMSSSCSQDSNARLSTGSSTPFPAMSALPETVRAGSLHGD